MTMLAGVGGDDALAGGAGNDMPAGGNGLDRLVSPWAAATAQSGASRMAST